jgi:hypothetical protein
MLATQALLEGHHSILDTLVIPPRPQDRDLTLVIREIPLQEDQDSTREMLATQVLLEGQLSILAILEVQTFHPTQDLIQVMFRDQNQDLEFWEIQLPLSLQQAMELLYLLLIVNRFRE